MKKILWVKFGWSEYYRGGPVNGNFGWLNENKKDERRGHEAFNFEPAPDGTYYCYVPPQAKHYAPLNEDPHGWTVICLAKNPRRAGIHIVGWYEDATLHGKWLVPPDNEIKKAGDINVSYSDRSYCISAQKAYFIPPDKRNAPFSDPSIKQGKYSFLEGPGVEINDNKIRVLNLLNQRMEKISPFAILNPNDINSPDPELNTIDPLTGFGTPEHRKRVEKRAEDIVITHYEKKGFTCKRMTHLPCGYDFSFTKGEEERHIEVKGTSSSTPQFFLTRKEHLKGMQSNSKWRLAMVTSALSESPNLIEYTTRDLKRVFELEPYVYIGRFLPTVKE